MIDSVRSPVLAKTIQEIDEEGVPSPVRTMMPEINIKRSAKNPHLKPQKTPTAKATKEIAGFRSMRYSSPLNRDAAFFSNAVGRTFKSSRNGHPDSDKGGSVHVSKLQSVEVKLNEKSCDDFTVKDNIKREDFTRKAGT